MNILGLTRRESEVANLLADGLTLRQAAKQLVVSLNTIQTTVTHIHRKLGVKSRGQLCHAVYEHRMAELRAENKRLRERLNGG
jgi:DNA-binding CsgD family transcriptional regulator